MESLITTSSVINKGRSLLHKVAAFYIYTFEPNPGKLILY